MVAERGRARSRARAALAPPWGLRIGSRRPTIGCVHRAVIVALFVLSSACDHPHGAPSETPSSVERSAPEPLEYVEALSADARGAEPLPLLVAFHGRGSTPERFAEIFTGLGVPARILSIRAPIDEGDGRAWFVFRNGGERAVADLRALVPRAMLTLRRYEADHATHGRPVVIGFSQGGMVAYELALAEPEHFAAIFPVSAVRLGSVPSRLPEGMPPMRAFHGADDPIIPVSAHEEDIEAFCRAGADATLTRVSGAPHWITGPMRAQLFTALRGYLSPRRPE